MDRQLDFGPSTHLATFLQLCRVLRALPINVVYTLHLAEDNVTNADKTTYCILITEEVKPSWGWYLTGVKWDRSSGGT